MVRMLRKSGTWNDMMEEMKVRVLKVASEKFREKRRAALDVGKFEFCNDLYITLAEVIYNTLKELMIKVSQPICYNFFCEVSRQTLCYPDILLG